MEIASHQDRPKIRTIGTKILIRPDVAKEQVVRGIIIPLANNNPLEEATVIIVSDEVEPYVHAGERIIYPKNTGVEQEYDGVKYKFINGPTATAFGDVWAII